MTMYNKPNMPKKANPGAVNRSVMDALAPSAPFVNPWPANPWPSVGKQGRPEAPKASGNPPESDIKPASGQTIKPTLWPAEEIKISPFVSQEEANPKGILDFSGRNLQEAVLWSEILGKPACKRRKRS